MSSSVKRIITFESASKTSAGHGNPDESEVLNNLTMSYTICSGGRFSSKFCLFVFSVARIPPFTTTLIRRNKRLTLNGNYIRQKGIKCPKLLFVLLWVEMEQLSNFLNLVYGFLTTTLCLAKQIKNNSCCWPEYFYDLIHESLEDLDRKLPLLVVLFRAFSDQAGGLFPIGKLVHHSIEHDN